MKWVGQNSIAYFSLLVLYVCLKREKNLTLKTCAPDFSARSMTKLYAKIKGAHAISLFDFPKTWQVWFDLDPFYTKVNLVTKAFEWEKVKIIYYLETIAALGLKVV